MIQHRLATRVAALLILGLAVPDAAANAQRENEPGSDATSRRTHEKVPVAPLSFASELSVGASVFTLDSTDIMGSVGESFSAVLAARVPGLSVLRPGGSAAEGSRVRLRGPRSFYTTTDPVVIVDGIRVNAMQESSVIDVGVRVSRLDDLALEDVARVDVLPGPAAASLFGPGAAGGALVITTKRGHGGSLRWSGRAESRVGLKPTGFPANYHMNGISTATGHPTTSCDVLAVGSGACTPTRLDTWNPLEQASPFRTARTTAGSVSLAGGLGPTAGRISATGRHTLGVMAGDDEGRLTLGANGTHRVTQGLDVGVHGGYARTSAGLPLRGNFSGDIIGAGLFGSATDDETRGYGELGPPRDTRQRATHWHGGVTAAWQPRSWLTVRALYGRDDLDQRDDQSGVFGGGTFHERAVLTHATTTLGASVATSYPVSWVVSVTGATSVGYERLGSAYTVTEEAELFSSYAHRRWAIEGPWLRQQIAWRDRLFVGGGLRLEQRRAWGRIPSAWFKSADASWSLGRVGRVDDLRLRAAYGAAGAWMAGNPGVRVSSPVSVVDASMLEPQERTAESEIGLDARLGAALTVALTAFRADGSRLYIDDVLPPTSGVVGGFLAPRGAIRNEGLEAAAGVRLLDLGGLRWDATLTGTALRNRVRSLGGAPPIIGTNNRTTPGYPVAGYWSRPYTYSDADGDGIIESAEIQYGDTAIFVGSSLPTREASLRSLLSLGRHLAAAVLLDYRGGHKLANVNERLRCNTYRNCRGAQDPTAPAAEQARYAVNRGGVTTDEFLQDASSVKLREVSLTWIVPARWAGRVGGGGAALTLGGRNVATWTRYDGLDPELDFRRFDELPRAELGKSPLLREIVLRLDIGSGAAR